MATYAIGDIQGCFLTLQRLLERIVFDPSEDRLWLAGDLVNRGPRSLETLRWAVSLDPPPVCVLGNHDLHLLAVSCGLRRNKRRDTLEAILADPARDELLAWLRQRPFLHRERGHLLVHAGLLPEWSAEQAEALARAAEARLRAAGWEEFLAQLQERPPTGELPCAVQAFVQLRAFDADGRPATKHKGPPASLPAGHRPWFEVPERATRSETVLFGHWAALGLHRAPGVVGLDSGCVWGRSLSAYRLEDGRVFQEPAAG